MQYWVLELLDKSRRVLAPQGHPEGSVFTPINRLDAEHKRADAKPPDARLSVHCIHFVHFHHTKMNEVNGV